MNQTRLAREPLRMLGPFGEEESEVLIEKPAFVSGPAPEPDDAPSCEHSDPVGRRGPSSKRVFLFECLREVLPVLWFSLVGSLLTGMLLDKMQDWQVFIKVEELFILVPILLNLKGNLEMNLAARLSTSANVGELDSRKTRQSIVMGNFALLQVQALIVSFMSGALAFGLGILSRYGIHHGFQHPIYDYDNPEHIAAGGDAASASFRGGYFEVLFVLCISMLATSISSGVLGAFTCTVVVLCRRFNINPDNISTPIAASLGDVITLTIVGLLSGTLVRYMGSFASTFVVILLIAGIGLNTVIAYRNRFTRELLGLGWVPLFVAMSVSAGAGLLLNEYNDNYRGFSVLFTVVAAISGNGAAVFVSRLGTSLHSSVKESPVFVGATLFSICVPTMLIFVTFVGYTGQIDITFSFFFAYTLCICIQMLIGLFTAYYLCHALWKHDYDPDIYAIPYLTSFLDVTCQILLIIAFTLTQKELTIADKGAAEAIEVASSVPKLFF